MSTRLGVGMCKPCSPPVSEVDWHSSGLGLRFISGAIISSDGMAAFVFRGKDLV